MTTQGATKRYFLRVRGKVMGPFTMEQLESLRDRGRLQPDHEVSRDRRNWSPASRLSQLFPSEEVGWSPAAEEEPSAAAPEVDGEEWFYTQGEEQLGPVPFARLQEAARNGELGEMDLVWNQHFSDWRPARTVKRLFPGSQSGRKGKRASRQERRITSTGFWDALLRSVRESVTVDDLENICQSLLRLGGYALMISMLAGPGFLVVQAIKLDSIELGLWGVAAFFGLAVLKYVAQRMSVAAHEVVSASPSRLSSTAFSDSIAVVCLFVAIASAGLFVLGGIQATNVSESVVAIVIGAQLLVTFGYAACTALHPDWLKVDCSTPVRAGEEGIGVISLILKIWVRFVPITFGVGAIVGTAGLILALLLLVIGGDWRLDALAYAGYSGAQLLVVSLLPAGVYLVMVLWSIFLDLAQSILILPEKIGSIGGETRETANETPSD